MTYVNGDGASEPPPDQGVPLALAGKGQAEVIQIVQGSGDAAKAHTLTVCCVTIAGAAQMTSQILIGL